MVIFGSLSSFTLKIRQVCNVSETTYNVVKERSLCSDWQYFCNNDINAFCVFFVSYRAWLVQRNRILSWLPLQYMQYVKKYTLPRLSKSKFNMTVPALCAPLGQNLCLVWRPSLPVYAKKMHPWHSQSLQFSRSKWWLPKRALHPV